MNTTIQKLVAVAAFAIAMAVASPSYAGTVYGKVTFVGTLAELVSGTVFEAQFRVRIYGTCDTVTAPRDRWLVVRSGQMQGNFTHNLANTRNAYSTLMAAFLSGRNVQFGNGSISCSSTATQNAALWVSDVGIY